MYNRKNYAYPYLSALLRHLYLCTEPNKITNKNTETKKRGKLWKAWCKVKTEIEAVM